MDTLFSRAFVTQPHTVLGCRLQPYTLAHQFALHALGSPFVMGGTVGWPDLRAALAICALPSPMAEVHRLATHMQLRPVLVARFRPESLRQHAERFAFYIQDHSAAPMMFAPSGKSDMRPTAPELLRVVCRLISCGFSQADAWRLTPGQAHWYCAGMCEVEGQTADIIDEETRELSRRVTMGLE